MSEDTKQSSRMSERFVNWQKQLQRTVQMVVPALQKALNDYHDQQERMLHPCLQHTKLFLNQLQIDMSQPVCKIIEDLLAPMVDVDDPSDETNDNKADHKMDNKEKKPLSSLMTSARTQAKIAELVQEWTAYKDLLYANNCMNIDADAVFRANPFDHDIQTIYLSNMTTNIYWRRIPNSAKNGFKLRHFDPLPWNPQQQQQHKSQSFSAIGTKRKQPSDDLKQAPNPMAKKPRYEPTIPTSKPSMEATILQGFAQITTNSSAACLVYLLDRVQLEIATLNHEFAKHVRELPTAKSFIELFLVMPPCTSTTVHDNKNDDSVPDAASLPDAVPSVNATEQKEEIKLLVTPPSWDYLDELCLACVESAILCNTVSISDRHRRFMFRCRKPLEALQQASSSEVITNAIKIWKTIEESLDKSTSSSSSSSPPSPDNLTSQSATFDTGTWKRKLSMANSKRYEIITTWTEQIKDLRGDLSVQRRALHAAERRHVEAWFTNDRHQVEFRKSQEIQEQWERAFEKEAVQLRNRWRADKVHQFDSVRAEFADIENRPLLPPDQYIKPFMDIITLLIERIKHIDRLLTIRSWTLPEDICRCIESICSVDLDSKKPWTWHNCLSWLKQASFVFVWYETMDVLFH